MNGGPRRALAAACAVITLGVAVPAGAGGPVPDRPDAIRFGEIGTFGPGCRPHTVDVAVSKERDSFTVKYFELLARGVAEETTMVHCVLTVPVLVPSGWAMRVTGLSLSGQTKLTGADWAKYTVDLRYIGSDLPGYELEEVVVEDADPYPFTRNRRLTTNFTPCGTTALLRLETALYAVDFANDRVAEISVVTQATAAAGSALDVEFQRCSH